VFVSDSLDERVDPVQGLERLGDLIELLTMARLNLRDQLDLLFVFFSQDSQLLNLVAQLTDVSALPADFPAQLANLLLDGPKPLFDLVKAFIYVRHSESSAGTDRQQHAATISAQTAMATPWMLQVLQH
jgi:hypothetical protein